MSERDQEVQEGRRAWGGAHVGFHGTRTIVSLWGEHDLCTADQVARALGRAVDAGAGDIVIDLAQVSFLDASTLGPIAGTDGMLRQQTRSLWVRFPSRLTSRMLTVCDMTRLLEASPCPGSASRTDPRETRSLEHRGHGP